MVTSLAIASYLGLRAKTLGHYVKIKDIRNFFDAINRRTLQGVTFKLHFQLFIL